MKNYVSVAPAEVPTCSITRANGAEVYVYAKLFRGEAGSLSIPNTVEVVGTTNARGESVELTDEEFTEAQRLAEKNLLR
jgi:hypothetical protein